MPLVRISLPVGRSPEYARAVGDAVHQAMVETAAVPPADRFQVITEEPAHGLIADPSYLGIERSADALFVAITLNHGRSLEVKRRLYARIAELLGERVGLRKQDVLVNLVEVAPENWSFGNGEAQYADRARPPIRRSDPEGLHRYPAFSQVVEVAAARTVVVSGQLAVDATGALVGAGDIEAQTEQVFRNLRTALVSVGLGLEHVVKLGTFLATMADLEGYRKVRRRWIPDDALPASTLVQARLVDAGYLVEMEAIAAG
jgi:enamine deaminase RidA (YjgF/YER057c/UK114 family)